MKLKIGEHIKPYGKTFEVTEVLLGDGEEYYVLEGWGDLRSTVTESELDALREDGKL